MRRRGKLAIFLSFAAIAGVVITILIVQHKRHRIVLRGAVIRQDSDPEKRAPIADVQIMAIDGSAVIATISEPSGQFRLIFQPGLKLTRERPVTLIFQHPGYQRLEMTVQPDDKIYIAAMKPLQNVKPPAPSGRPTKITNVSVRYSVRSVTTLEIGSTAKTFDVVNVGNTPCNHQPPCSPDGKWKAANASASLDAGEQNEFRNVRVSCIAGPCPFTKIDRDHFSQGGRNISVTVRNWSDSATFLIEAEVVRPTTSDIVRTSYPVILGQQLNFSLPGGGIGPSIEAELDGTLIVFPLGPELCLSWADCKLTTDHEGNQLYRCSLNPGYTF